MSWDNEEERRRVDAVGLVPDNVPVFRVAEINKAITSDDYKIGLLVIDCPTCAALVRLDAWREHDRWHDGGSR